MGYFLMLVSVSANLSEGILIKKYNAKHSKGGMFFTGIISLFAMLYFLLTDKEGFYSPTAMLPYAAAFGIIYCIAYLLTFVALANGSFTMSMLIISYSTVFPIIFGILWLDEAATILTYIGFALLALSLFLVRGKKETGTEKKNVSLKWLIAIILTSVGNGLLAIIKKMQQIKFDNACNNEFMVLALSISAAVLLIGGLVRERKDIREIVVHGTPYAGAAGVANGLHNLMTIYINNLLPISISSPAISGIKIVFSYLVSSIFFRERYLNRQVIGVAIGAAAVIFLNL